jgi:arginine-tRNA-protein transferase
MKYKAEYSPSFLLDPVTYEFLPFNEVCKPLLDADDHAIFSECKEGDTYVPRITSSRDSEGRSTAHADTGGMASAQSVDKVDSQSESESESETEDEDEDEAEDETELSKPPPPGFLDPDHIPDAIMRQVYTIEANKPLPLVVS